MATGTRLVWKSERRGLANGDSILQDDSVDADHRVVGRSSRAASTSIGANYCEANDSESKKDFRHKIGLCRKESRETKHWLRMLVAAVPEWRQRRENCGWKPKN